jgi:hypothetical protein
MAPMTGATMFSLHMLSSPVPRGRWRDATEGVFLSTIAQFEANTRIPPTGYFPRWAGEEVANSSPRQSRGGGARRAEGACGLCYLCTATPIPASRYFPLIASLGEEVTAHPLAGELAGAARLRGAAPSPPNEYFPLIAALGEEVTYV